jgi:hypothetical protein
MPPILPLLFAPVSTTGLGGPDEEDVGDLIAEGVVIDDVVSDVLDVDVLSIDDVSGVLDVDDASDVLGVNAEVDELSEDGKDAHPSPAQHEFTELVIVPEL